MVHHLGRGLFAVIDGMGGEVAGDVAAALAAERIAAAGERSLVTVFGEIRDAIDARWRAEPRLWGMGAVATAARVRGGVAEIAHVGDTRAFLWRPGAGLRQLTRDHTIAQEARDMFGAGAAVPGANRVTRDLGSCRGPPDHWVDARTEALAAGDRLLLTSDGLHDVLSADEIAAVLDRERDPAAAADAFVARVCSRGAPDNVSVVIVALEPAA